VRQRLLNHAKANNRPFQELLQYYAMERFLYRLAQSPYAGQFVLKGALLFTVWGAPASRPTKDIDFLGRMKNSVEAVTSVIRAVCNQAVEADGLVFDAVSVAGRVIKEDADYEGVRVTFPVALQNARVAMQLDVGFGDVMVPAAALTNYPTILDFAAPRLYGYRRETVVAEKFEALVKLGQLNSRLKDFYDLWLLSRHFDFDGPVLAKAIANTFAHRGTPVTQQPFALTPTFTEDAAKRTQWQGFRKKSRLENATEELRDVVEALGNFLAPLAVALEQALPFEQVWKAPGSWQAH
jgi:hypothetical protein